MKKLILCFAIFVFVANLAYAKSFLIIDKNTKEVISLSPEDDAQLSNKDWQKVVLPDNFTDIQLQYHPTYYKYQNNKFVVNIKKLSDEELAIQKAEKRVQEEALIQKELRNQAIKSLKDRGVTLEIFKEE